MADEYSMPTQPTPKRNYDLAALLSNITDVEDANTYFRGGIYAEPGCGKTYAAVELAQRITDPNKKILHVYTGTNWDSVKDVPALTRRLKKKPFTDFDEIRDLCAALKQQNIREKLGIGCVIFDEFNTMFDINVEYLTNFRSTLPQKDGKYKDPDTPEWPEYNTAKNHMNNLMNDVLQTPDIHFIFVAHPRRGKRTKMIEPDFFDKAAQAFMRPLSSLYYLSTDIVDGKVVRKFQLQGTDQVTAKNRVSGLSSYATSVKQISDAYLKWGLTQETSSTEQEPPKSSQAVEEEKPVESPSSPKNEEVVRETAIASEDSPQVTKEETDDLFDLLNV